MTKAKIKKLCELGFLHNLENLLILGKTGLGKTHLAIALGKRLCQEGHPTEFVPVNFLFEEIQAAKAAGRYLNYVRSLIKAKVLILDDLGLRNYTLEERYHKAPLIVTSQVEPQGWLKLFEDPVIGEAIVDRLIHPCQKTTLKGDKSYREKLTENKSIEKPWRVKLNSSKSLRRFAPPISVVPFLEIGWAPKMKSNKL